jgi:hypothetical protein
MYRDPAVASIKRHLAFMASHPAASCYRDAYAADQTIGKNWLGILATGSYPNDLTGQGRAQTTIYDEALANTNAFLSHLSAYFSDCR